MEYIRTNGNHFGIRIERKIASGDYFQSENVSSSYEIFLNATYCRLYVDWMFLTFAETLRMCYFQDHYLSKFESLGYDDTSFLHGLEDNDLKDIGIRKRGHRNAILDAIKLLPEPEIEPCVPVIIRLAIAIRSRSKSAFLYALIIYIFCWYFTCNV
jgi:hypothetical protein